MQPVFQPFGSHSLTPMVTFVVLGSQEDDGILADTRTFGILIDGSVKKGDLDTADFWLQRAELAGLFDPTADVIEFCLLRCFGNGWFVTSLSFWILNHPALSFYF